MQYAELRKIWNTRMRRELAEEIFSLIEARCQTQPRAMEFELAYQARVAIDRIRFAIKHTEQFGPHTDQMREAGLHLLDALERLESAERNFQKQFRGPQEFAFEECAAQANAAAHGGPRGGGRDGI